ncbi:MAG: hypothetical protein WBK26_05290 [Burkholderiaceae bacterium]
MSRFSDLEARINATVMRTLGNWEITLDGVACVGIVSAGMNDLTFDGPGPAGSSPSVLLPANKVPARPEGKTLVITSGPAAGSYKVRSQEPDGTGLVTLYLTKS